MRDGDAEAQETARGLSESGKTFFKEGRWRQAATVWHVAIALAQKGAGACKGDYFAKVADVMCETRCTVRLPACACEVRNPPADLCCHAGFAASWAPTGPRRRQVRLDVSAPPNLRRRC